jgi:hypothetical protein
MKTGALMVALLSLVFSLVGLAGPIAQEPSLRYEIPADWASAVDPQSGVTSLMPRRLPFGRVCVITVFSPEHFTGAPGAFHDEIVHRATGYARALEPPRRDSLGGFQLTRLHQIMPNGVQLWLTVYTARWGEQGQAFVLSANTADIARKYTPIADAMISRIAVPLLAAAQATPAEGPIAAGNGAPPPPPCLRPTGIEICPKAVVPDDPAMAIVGAYIAAAARSSFSVGTGVQSRVSTEILLLFGNGVAARSSAIKSGAMDDLYWSEGFATMDPRDPAQLGARRAGRWTERNGTITIAWQIGQPTTLTRDGQKLREEYTVWSPYLSIDGLRLDGRYQRRPEEYVSPSGITFHRDGTFDEDGLNVTMGGTTINPGFPERGAGRYQISRWSLILRFSTGFVQSINLLVGEGDAASPPDIVLNGYDYIRARPQ